ncbi:MAG TPA: hypothetical protein VE974_07730 [Thermoanaerobaculia bacterium]|nr:hypothetical protein [Thermoanaerobaculia bacterium]
MKKVSGLLFLLLISTSAFAQSQFRGSAKFVCGKTGQDVIDAFAFAPGAYFTSINVTNPNAITVSGTKRFSIGLLSQVPGKFTPLIGWALKPSETMQVDCGDIYKQMNIPPGTFIDGFVHFVGSPSRFDVTAVHTVTDGDSRLVSMDVEQIVLR